jgi:hypothetical protein
LLRFLSSWAAFGITQAEVPTVFSTEKDRGHFTIRAVNADQRSRAVSKHSHGYVPSRPEKTENRSTIYYADFKQAATTIVHNAEGSAPAHHNCRTLVLSLLSLPLAVSALSIRIGLIHPLSRHVNLILPSGILGTDEVERPG